MIAIRDEIPIGVTYVDMSSLKGRKWEAGATAAEI